MIPMPALPAKCWRRRAKFLLPENSARRQTLTWKPLSGRLFGIAGYDCNYHVEVRLHTQSPDIADAVDGETLGAGDQGIMYGYACWETVELLPAPVVLANRITSLLTTCREEKLISGIGPDGKAQVSVQYAFGVPERVDTIVISCQHDADKDPDELREELSAGWSLPAPAMMCASMRIQKSSSIHPADLCWAALKPIPVSPAVS